MSILGQIHVLSTLMAIILLIPFFVIGLYLAKDIKSVWISFFKALLGTLCLTANVWGAYIVLLSRNKLATPDAFNMVFSGLRVTGYHGCYGTYGTMFAFMLPLITILFFLQFLWILFHLKNNLVNTVVTIWGSILLVIASIYFPWGFVQRIFPFLENTFQFPFRLTAIIYPMLIVGIGLTIQGDFSEFRWKKILSYSLVGLVFIESLGSVVRTTNYYSIHHSGDELVKKFSKSTDLSKFFETKVYGKQLDYIPVTKKNINIPNNKKKYKKDVILASKHFHHVVKSGKLILKWNANNKIILPVVMYAQSQLRVNNNKFKGDKTVLGSPIVRQRKGINFASLYFKVPTYYYVLLVLTVACWLIVIGDLFYRKLVN